MNHHIATLETLEKLQKVVETDHVLDISQAILRGLYLGQAMIIIRLSVF